MEPYDLICIGSGPAGEKAATQAAYYRKRVAIVERAYRPGGAMVNTGTIPSKALRETALLCSAFRRRPLPGVDFSIDHTLSVPRFMARRHLIEQQEHDRIEHSMDRHGIDVHRGFGRISGAHTVEVVCEGGIVVLPAHNILVATGSSPLRPAHVPFGHPGVVDADGVLDLPAIPRRMIIVGGGVIGAEYASIFAEIDVRVTLVDPRKEILSFLDAECRDHLLRAMQERGVEIRLGVSVAAVEPREDGAIDVRCADSAILTAETVLWAAGRSSNTAGLGLEAMGVEMGDRGLVLVDGHYRTNIPSIYAAGDVIGFPALAATSMEQGRVAACHMFGIDFKQRIAETIPIGLYTVPGISMVGPTSAQATEAGRDVVCGYARYRQNVRGRMLGDEQGLLKCVFERGSRRLLGATIVGEQATELIHLAQCAIAHGAGIDFLLDACFNYPSLTELYKYAAYDALQSLARDDGRASELGAAARAA